MNQTRILFVCLGNICRSPMAEFVMKDLVRKAGLERAFQIESAATSYEEIGNPVYPPARRELAAHGISCDGKTARHLEKRDYAEFDYLIGMETSNLRNMRRICGGDPEGKMHLLLDFAEHPGEIDDPWYTGRFSEVYDQILEGCRGLLARCGESGGERLPVLVTAFEPFGGRETNASLEVLRTLPDRIGGQPIQKRQLPVAFGKAAEAVRGSWSRIFLLGEAGRETVTPETTARNLRNARIPDNAGNQPENARIRPEGPEEYRTAVPVEDIVARMRAEGYAIAVSNDAGAFVCNDTFYLVGTESRVPVSFIHVPVSLPEEAADTVRRFIELALQAEA